MVPLFTSTYMVIANVLLLNLLIAMLNRTYEKVEEEAEEVSNYLQYELITEYFRKPIIPPPLIIIPHLYRLFKPKARVDDAAETKSSKTYFNQGMIFIILTTVNLLLHNQKLYY